jgi:hypothetical protein
MSARVEPVRRFVRNSWSASGHEVAVAVVVEESIEAGHLDLALRVVHRVHHVAPRRGIVADEPAAQVHRSQLAGVDHDAVVEDLAALGAPRGHLEFHADRRLETVLLVGDVGDVPCDRDENPAPDLPVELAANLRKGTGWSAVKTRDLPSSAPCPLHRGPEP